MDLNYLRDLLAIFDASTATELTIEEEGTAISLSRRPAESTTHVYGSFPQQFSAPSAPAMQQAIVPAPAQASSPTTAAPAAEAKAESSGPTHTITSPIVGTFYRSPSPDAEAYVQVGSHISAGQTLCIVEAMKLMNEIESDINGTVLKVLVNNAQPVEYNQPLFIIQPD
jgi:acetyl-CoA carboxylase biotin carboxyl carrier protein